MKQNSVTRSSQNDNDQKSFSQGMNRDSNTSITRRKRKIKEFTRVNSSITGNNNLKSPGLILRGLAKLLWLSRPLHLGRRACLMISSRRTMRRTCRHAVADLRWRWSLARPRARAAMHLRKGGTVPAGLTGWRSLTRRVSARWLRLDKWSGRAAAGYRDRLGVLWRRALLRWLLLWRRSLAGARGGSCGTGITERHRWRTATWRCTCCSGWGILLCSFHDLITVRMLMFRSRN